MRLPDIRAPGKLTQVIIFEFHNPHVRALHILYSISNNGVCHLLQALTTQADGQGYWRGAHIRLD